MIKRNIIIGLALMVEIGTAYSNTCLHKESETDKQSIEKLIDHYIESINLSDTAIVNEIWSHESNVSFIAPSGYYGSYETIRDSLVVGLFGTKFTERDLKKTNLKISINGNNAWAEFFWTFHATKINGKSHDTKGCETQIFEKSKDGQWRLVHIHYSSIK